MMYSLTDDLICGINATKIGSTRNVENLTKLSLAELEDLYERENNILKNKKLINHLPDKGKQLQQKVEQVKKELALRRDMKEIEGNLKTLRISCEISKEKHVQHICSIEKSPKKERYKPFSTLVKKGGKSENPTQLIPLVESITLLTEQATKLPLEQAKRKIEGTELKQEEEQQE